MEEGVYSTIVYSGGFLVTVWAVRATAPRDGTSDSTILFLLAVCLLWPLSPLLLAGRFIYVKRMRRKELGEKTRSGEVNRV
jgi:hypothetical protein